MGENKVLIVDDDVDLLILLKLELSAWGYSVFTATSGEAGLRFAKEKHPDVIVLDIMLPGLSGGEVAETLKTDPATKDIPVIFLTCLYSKGEEAALGNLIHGNVIIAKPFESKELLEEIEKHLAKKV